jgi:Protein of unknown function (DUF1488)
MMRPAANIDIGGRRIWFRSIAAAAPAAEPRRPMALNFPNESRSFDGTRRAVRFWGYDSAMEAAFFVSEAALKTIQPDMRLDEAGMLRAFDSNRGRIYAAAAKVYARGRRGSYDLDRSDF